MNPLNDLSLEDLLQRGLQEANEQFKENAPELALYSLYLVEKRFKREGKPTPVEIQDFIRKMGEEIRRTYPQKIKEALQNGDVEDAMDMFHSLGIRYSQDQKLPASLYESLEIIRERSEGVVKWFRNAFFCVYPKERFEEK